MNQTPVLNHLPRIPNPFHSQCLFTLSLPAPSPPLTSPGCLILCLCSKPPSVLDLPSHPRVQLSKKKKKGIY